MNYYSLEDAMGLLNTFASWIGKKAHVGQGQTETLRGIEVKESAGTVKAMALKKKYTILFKFENKQFTVNEFLRENKLEPLVHHIPSFKQNRQRSQTGR